MKFIIQPRQYGKTTQLIEWARQDPCHVIVVHSHQEYHRLLHAYAYGTDERPEVAAADGRERIGTFQLITASELKDHPKMGWHGAPVFAIDNIDLVLPQLVGAPIEVITGTPEEDRG